VKRLASGARIVLKSHFGYEITRINIYEDRFLIAVTVETLLIGDLESCKLSEVPWAGSGDERYYFDHPQVCIIFNSGELTLVEYGRNEVLGSCRTEHVSPHLVSVRLSQSDGAEIKKVAYLLDLQTIRVTDLVTAITEATIAHESKVDWMEMNCSGTKLLFRDKRRALHLYDLATQTRSTLLSFSSYVQWVPNSDVVVAQNRGNLCVWYHIDAVEKVTVVPIRGEVEDIERAPGRTEVIVDEGMNTVSYELNEALIAFGSAIDKGNLDGACSMLEALELTSETESMWDQLSLLALQREDTATAERCFGAVGNVSKARYLHKVNSLINAVEVESGVPGMGATHFRVQSKLSVLAGEYARAEQLLLQQGLVEDAMEMYQELHKWEESIAVAEQRQHPEVSTLKSNYFKWLTQTGQEEKAAEQMEREHDLVSAIHLFLKGGLPARAAAVVIRYDGRESFQAALLETIAGQLFTAGMYERAGSFFERLDDPQRAMDCYRKGQAYGRAVELSRRCFQGRDVVELEQLWGDFLVACKNPDAAINHYTEAGSYVKAIQAAIACRQWPKASQIVETLEPAEAKPYFHQMAKHYEVSRHYEEAEQFYLRAGAPQGAVEMYAKTNKWEHAHRVATQHMSQADAAMLYIAQAHRLEQAGKFKEAERLYVMVHEPDLAINMHKKSRRYDDMIRLVTSYRKELLTETHLHLAQQLETEGNFKLSERHYVEANDWGSAVNMYRANDLWDEAVRVAQRHGGPNASKKVSYAWAVSLGGEAGAKLLTKFGLIEQAIDYAIESGAFEHAFALAQASRKEKLPEVHLKFAMYLEDEGRFNEAEQEFVKADKPKEAIDMYVHQQDWANATRVAEANDPGSLSEVMVSQAKMLTERSEFTKAEALYVRAKKPELAVQAYKSVSRWNDALRIANEFLPHKVQELIAEHKTSLRGETPSESQEVLVAQGRSFEEARDFSAAIDAYLCVTAAQTKNHAFLEEVWESAVKLAMNHVPTRIHEVVENVSKRLVDINRYSPAAELYEGIDHHREAIAVYIKGGLWDNARDLAKQMGPKMEREVHDAHTRLMAQAGAADDLVYSGAVAEGIEAYAQKGDWVKCLEVAQQQGPQMLLKYATLHGASLIQQGDFASAARVFVTHGTATHSPQNIAMYRRLAKEMLSRGTGNDVRTDPVHELLVLRTMLTKAVVGLRVSSDDKLKQEFDLLLWVSHLTAAKDMAEKRRATDAQRKLAIALLRHVRILPADKAFYDAGVCCRQANDLSMAFVFFNRYLDITEAMEENEARSASLDNTGFANTEIPCDFDLPEKQYLSDRERDKVRDYVLELSMNEKVEQQLIAADLHVVFSEIDAVRDAVMRTTGRAGSGSDLYMLVRDTIAEVVL